MGNMLRLVLAQSEEAKSSGDLVLTYDGTREEGGRPAYMFTRTLPNKRGYPCAVLTIYIDRETLACVRTDSYDWSGSLFAHYSYSNIMINVGLVDRDFDPDNRDYGYRLF